ncbi:hypothetical protein [Candidatus Arsenophonus triatominarum]|uniref:hypothetical protein n=1 Tax=Candidatus Arsenophonus triatominarum TaxID=57911 RepID=UPI0007C5B343|nr:hypothetical protein [Candidatus Arsenophonus triatominarum]
MLEYRQAGLDVGEVLCFSVKSPSPLRILFKTLSKGDVTKKLLGILKMFNQQRNVRIEVYTDKKIIDLNGYSEEESRRLIEASHGVRISPS